MGKNLKLHFGVSAESSREDFKKWLVLLASLTLRS